MLIDLLRPSRPHLALLVLLATLLATGCSTVATGTWFDPRTENAPFSTVVVVGVIPDARMRRDIERYMTADIVTGQTNAYSSKALEAKHKLKTHSHESVVAMIAETGADAVLVIRILDTTITPGRSQTKAYVDIGPQVEVIAHPGFTEIYASSYAVHEDAAQLVIENDTKMQALLYDIEDGARVVYKVEVETKYEEKGGDVDWVISGNVADAVTAKLRHAGLIH